MAFAQISTSVTIINSGLSGFFGLSLTNFTVSAVSAIASGSAIEIAGAFFKADSDLAVNASSWTAITTATNAYLVLTPSGSAGSQIITAAWSATAPTWSESKQGYYASAASTSRYVATAWKTSATSQEDKSIIQTIDSIPNGLSFPVKKRYYSTAFTTATTVINTGIDRLGGATSPRIKSASFSYTETTGSLYGRIDIPSYYTASGVTGIFTPSGGTGATCFLAIEYV